MSSYGAYRDDELIVLLKQSNQLAFAEIYNRYRWVLYLHALKRIGNREESKDIIQELFTTLWDKRFELDLKSHLSGYLYTSVRNRVIKLITHNKIESGYMESLRNVVDDATCITDYRVRESNLAEIIEKEINDLPPKMREVFIMSRKLHMSHKEIAGELRIEESTVKRQVSNALKILRTKLGLIIWLYFIFKY